MSIVGRYRLSHSLEGNVLDALILQARHWLEAKRSVDSKIVSIETVGGSSEYAVVREDLSQGTLVTSVYYGVENETLDFYMDFDFKQSSSSFQSSEYELLRPKIVKNVIEIDKQWKYGQDVVLTDYIYVKESSDLLIKLILDQSRMLPIIVVSNSMVSRKLSEKLAYDLCGLANVFEISNEVSWSLTEALGRELSCFGGYIRLYWPFLNVENNPFRHPLINISKMFSWEEGPVRGASKLLRRILFTASVNAINPPKALTNYVSQKRDVGSIKEIQKLHALISNLSNERSILEDLLDSVGNVELDLRRYREQNEQLLKENENLRENAKYFYSNVIVREGLDNVIASSSSEVSENLSDAVKLALSEFSEYIELLPGAEVMVDHMDQSAGPPSKVKAYLAALADLSKALRLGPIGTTQIHWLKQNKINASGESETIKNNKNAMRRRTWRGFEEEDVEIETHLKPNDNTSPDKCVRIYFKYDQKRGRMGIGYIGRHID